MSKPRGRARRVRPPITVARAFGLMLLRSTVSLVSLIITVADRDEVRERILERTPTASEATVDGALTFAIGFVAVFLVLYLALAFAVRGGSNRARVLTWVLAGVGVIGLIGTLTQPTVDASRALGVANGLIDIAIVVLLALGPSNDYFRGR